MTSDRLFHIRGVADEKALSTVNDLIITSFTRITSVRRFC